MIDEENKNWRCGASIPVHSKRALYHLNYIPDSVMWGTLMQFSGQTETKQFEKRKKLKCLTNEEKKEMLSIDPSTTNILSERSAS